MNKLEIEQLRKSNSIPFIVIDWLESLSPVVTHEELGVIYKGCILAQDGYGKYAAIVGTSDRLINNSSEIDSNMVPFKILKVEKKIVPFCRRDADETYKNEKTN